MISDQKTTGGEYDGLVVMFRIISRRSWDELQDWRRACSGSTVEHLAHGLFVLAIPPDGVGESEAA